VNTPPRSFQDLVARVSHAAVEISGGDHSDWDGRPPAPPKRRGLHAATTPGGGYRLNEERVMRPLREMMATAGQQHDPQTLERYKQALLSLYHEANHLVVGAGERWSDYERSDRWSTPLEEGVTEAFSHRHLGDLIDRLGLEQVAPGLSRAEVTREYPSYVPAAETLARGVGAMAGLSEDEVLRQLNSRAPTGKLPAVADMVLHGTGLSGRIPPQDIPQWKTGIEETVRRQLQPLPSDTTRKSRESYERMSGRTGRNAVRELEKGVQGLEALHPETPQINRRQPSSDLERKVGPGSQPELPTRPAIEDTMYEHGL
jgi:hypothetical protein